MHKSLSGDLRPFSGEGVGEERLLGESPAGSADWNGEIIRVGVGRRGPWVTLRRGEGGNTSFISVMRRVFRPDPLTCIMFALLSAIIYVAFFHQSSPPIEYFGTDSVTPQRVKAGEIISVTRSFRIKRSEDFTVTRALVRGDCTRSCEIVDMSTSQLTLEPNEYRNVERRHTIPRRVDPGVWELRFTFHWHDFLGRDRTLPLPPLFIEVVNDEP